MQLHYHKHPGGNFGDDLNAWIWDALLPGWQDWDDDVTLIGVGTLLNEDRLAAFRDRRILVIGSGVGYGTRQPHLPLASGWDIRALRGPLSARALGLPETLGVIDPAAMIPELDGFRDLPKSDRLVFVPHADSVRRHDWAALCQAAGIDYVSPQGEAREVIRRIGSARLVVAEAMHAAIIADAFRVPWVPVSISRKFNPAKWQDWAASLGLTPEIPPLFPMVDRLDRATPTIVSRLRRAARPSAAAVPGQTAGRSGPGERPPSRRMRILLALERLVAVSRLRAAGGRRGYLSDTAVLEEKRALYRWILAETTRHYGRVPA